MWARVRVNAFQLESLKMVVQGILKQLLYYKRNPDELAEGLTVRA